MPRVNGGSPGRPTSRAGSNSSQRPGVGRRGSPWWSTSVGPPAPPGPPSGAVRRDQGPYRRSTSTSEMVEKRGRRSGLRASAGSSTERSQASRRSGQSSRVGRSLMRPNLARGPVRAGVSADGRSPRGRPRCEARRVVGGRVGQLHPACRVRLVPPATDQLVNLPRGEDRQEAPWEHTQEQESGEPSH